MKSAYIRRRYRRPAAKEIVVSKKDNNSEQQFFGEAAHEPFFKPAVALQQGIQRKCADCEKEDKLQRSSEKNEEEKVMKKEEKKEKLQRLPDKKEEEKINKKESAASTTNITTTASNYIGSINGKGQSMDAGVQSFYECKIGADFSDVKIHTGKEAADSAKDINAQAYAYGNHIVFNEGKYQPQTSEGKHLLAHELAHVVQNNDSYATTLNRQPVTEEDVPKQSDYEKKVKDKTWCRDTEKSGQLHPGMQCYRELKNGDGYPDARQFCFDKETGLYPGPEKGASPDFVSAVNGINEDGTCDIGYAPHPFTKRGRRTAGHFIGDICTEDANLCGGGFGIAAGTLVGIGMPKDGLDTPGISTLAIPAIMGSLTGFLLSKGMPVISRFAEKRGFLPSYSIALGGNEQNFQTHLGMGFEKRDKPLIPLPIRTYLTFGADAGLSVGADGTSTSVAVKLGIRVDPGKQGGLFVAGSAGAGALFGDDISSFITKELSAGYRMTDFMDIEAVSAQQEGEGHAVFMIRLNMVAPQRVLKGHPKTKP